MDDFIFSVTGYVGYEDKILKIRNANRNIEQSRGYLDWRYAKLPDVPDPLVFWIESASGEAVGMASMIFRPYWLNNAPIHLGVVGDIALDSSLRGQGLGKGLMLFIKEHLEQKLSGQAAFVIPNDAAQKSLTAAKWETGGKLVPYVLLFDPAEKLTSLLKCRSLARLVAFPIRTLFFLVARLRTRRGFQMQFVNRLDESFATLWKAIPKDDMILSDRGPNFLIWRYLEHPHKNFSIAKFLRGSELAGYLIFECSPSDGTCLIYDLQVRDQCDLLCMLSLFVLHSTRLGNIGTIRITLNDKHPFSGDLWKMGFIKRGEQATFLVHWPKGFSQNSPLNWFLSSGDKDI